MTSILIFGFSVTAQQDGYAPRVRQALLDTNRISRVDIVAIGGLDVDFAAFAIEDVLDRHRYDLVVLDITSGQGRSRWLSPGRFIAAYNEVLIKVIRTGARPMVIDLFRTDIDYAFKTAARIKALNDRLGIAGLYLGEQLAARPDVRNLLTDDVHPNPEGVAFYSREVTRFLAQAWDPAPSLPDVSAYQERLYACLPALLVSPDRTQNFSRAGYDIDCVRLLAGDTVTLTFDRPVTVTALTFVSGPDSGILEVSAPDHPQQTLSLAVNFSYYAHLRCKYIEPVFTSQLALRQLPDIPEVRLLKGSLSDRPRVGLIGQVALVGDDLPRARLTAVEWASSPD